MDISIVIPLLNEEESLKELYSRIDEELGKASLSFEILFIDDGSTDGSWKVIRELSEKDERVRGIKFRRNYGKSAALNTGFERTKGNVVVTMDADLQDDPKELPEMYDMIVNKGFDLVSGWKKKRYDPLMKTIPSKFFNAVTRYSTNIHIHDFNCGLKAYRAPLVKAIEVYGEMHRYIPVIAKRAGYTKITEKVVTHHARKYGESKFGMKRFINGFLDLLSILFVTKFSKKPMHFFGSMGTLVFLVGFGILVYLSVSKLFFNVTNMTDRPIFYLGLLTVIIGSQLFLTGFLAELVSRNAPDRNIYHLEETLN